eukprot:tig00001286_g8018.t1
MEESASSSKLELALATRLKETEEKLAEMEAERDDWKEKCTKLAISAKTRLDELKAEIEEKEETVASQEQDLTDLRGRMQQLVQRLMESDKALKEREAELEELRNETKGRPAAAKLEPGSELEAAWKSAEESRAEAVLLRVKAAALEEELKAKSKELRERERERELEAGRPFARDGIPPRSPGGNSASGSRRSLPRPESAASIRNGKAGAPAGPAAPAPAPPRPRAGPGPGSGRGGPRRRPGLRPRPTCHARLHLSVACPVFNGSRRDVAVGKPILRDPVYPSRR